MESEERPPLPPFPLGLWEIIREGSNLTPLYEWAATIQNEAWTAAKAEYAMFAGTETGVKS